MFCFIKKKKKKSTVSVMYLTLNFIKQEYSKFS